MIYKSISTYRNELMGWAIVWIMMLHFTFTQIKPLGFVAQYGFAGVEIFMLVSGFGLFFSLDKDSHLLRFYKKRLFRIFPTYYIIGVFSSLIVFHDDILTYLYRFSTIGFWTGGPYCEWYIPSIVMLYLFAPLVKKITDLRLFYVLALVIAVSIGLSLYFVDKEHLLDRSHFFFLYRISAFVMGMLCAYCMKHGLSEKYYWAVLVVGLPVFVLLFPRHHAVYNYKYLSLLFLLPVFTLAFTAVSKYVRLLNPVIGAIGKASLEVYLIQGIFFSCIIRGIITVPASWHDVVTVGLIVLCSLLGIAAHWLIDKSGILRLL